MIEFIKTIWANRNSPYFIAGKAVGYFTFMVLALFYCLYKRWKGDW